MTSSEKENAQVAKPQHAESGRSPRERPAPRFLAVGQVLRPHGIRGAIGVQISTHYPERLKNLEKVVLAPEPEKPEKGRPCEVEWVHTHQQGISLFKFKNVDNRDQADALREQYVLIPLADAVPLEEDEYYFFQLIGLAMYTDTDELLGEVAEILETGANEVYVVRGPRYGEILIPAIEQTVQKIDLEAGRITIKPLPGLIPDLDSAD